MEQRLQPAQITDSLAQQSHLQLPFAHGSRSRVDHIDVACFHSDATLSYEYAVSVRNRFSVLGDVSRDSVEASWEKLSGVIMTMAKFVIGVKQHIKQQWMSSHNFDILKEKAVARDRGLTVERQRL